MELLIPGLILVALMAYASTRIKKAAAQAFEPETIETEEFTFEKPAEFLNVLNLRPGLTLDAYSRNFGTEFAKDIRQARAEIRTFENKQIADVIAAIKDSAEIISDTSEILNGRKYHLIEAGSVEKGVGLRHFYKIAESSGKVFELNVTALENMDEEIDRAVGSMVDGFVVK